MMTSHDNNNGIHDEKDKEDADCTSGELTGVETHLIFVGKKCHHFCIQ
jgi:hypothetical protein